MMQISKTILAGLVAAACLTSVSSVRAEAPAVPADPEQCLLMVEAAIAEQRKGPALDAKATDTFDLVVGKAVQGCDKKDFAAAHGLILQALASLKK